MSGELYFSGRNAITLKRAEGIVVSYDGEELPFEAPLVIGEGTINGVRSGNRSALVGPYKLKGCAPESGKLYDLEPFGAMSKENCISELFQNQKVSKVYEKYEIDAPLYSRGFFEYEGGTCCEILECTGDMRMSELKFLELPKNHPDLWNYGYLDLLFSEIAKWVGFNHRVLVEAGVCPIKESFDFDNYAIHSINGGFGIARVDLEDTCETAFGMKKDFDLREITRVPRIISEVDLAKDFGIPYKEFRKGTLNGKKMRLESSETERKEDLADEVILYFNPVRFKHMDAIKKKYLEFAEGTGIPEPIPANVIMPMFL